MDKPRVRGGHRFNGTVTISGGKNAARPDLSASPLTAEPRSRDNVPGLQDVSTMLKLLRSLGCGAEWVEG
jgi:UDP-N-acetylglucosamine 1-carboxyvinyltransferase